MLAPLGSEIQEEAELIERFVRSYRRKFAEAIDLLNRDAPSAPALRTEHQCLRLCVEAMDMVLVSQDRLARSLRKMTARESLRSAA